MWISKAHYTTLDGLIQQAQAHSTDALRREGALRQRVSDLETENTRLIANQDWFKLRLTQVERERAQLIYAAIGTKVSVPEFVPTYRPDEALNEQHAVFAGVGEDSADLRDRTPDADGTDELSHMPGFVRELK